MDKRPNEISVSNDSKKKKLNFNIWSKEKELHSTITPPATPPATPNNNQKYDFNIWNKSAEKTSSNEIKIGELAIGIW